MAKPTDVSIDERKETALAMAAFAADPRSGYVHDRYVDGWIACARAMTNSKVEMARREVSKEARVLIEMVDGREKGLVGYYIDAWRFNALRDALAAEQAAAERNGHG